MQSEMHLCRYLTGELLEEQVYKNANAGLKQLYHRISNSIKEQEISFAQRNPPVVQQMQQAEEDRLDGLKNKLRDIFRENRMRGQQQWKEARSRLEAEHIEILKKINGVLEEDLKHLTVNDECFFASIAQDSRSVCRERKHMYIR